jgi:LL-diaminopimelate aminotransferase
MGSSIFQEMEQWQDEAIAKGQSLIHLGIGSPDQAPSERVMRALTNAVQQPANYRYPQSNGTTALRQMIAHWFAVKFNVNLDPEHEVLVLMGTQDGLAHLALALADEGDMALIPDPGYPIYETNLILAGVTPYYLSLQEKNAYKPQFHDVPAEVWERARFLLLNYPSNPLTVTAERDVFEEAVAYCQQHQLVMVHDYAYSEMIFGEQPAISLMQFEGARDCGLEFHSFSKSFNMAGCRIGFVVGNKHAIAALSRLKANIDYGVFLAIQEAAIEALREDLEQPIDVASCYAERAQLFCEELATFGWQLKPPTATMFIWVKIPESWQARTFARELVLATGVVVTPGDAFGRQGEGYIRIALVQSPERLRLAAQKIGQFWKERVYGSQ